MDKSMTVANAIAKNVRGVKSVPNLSLSGFVGLRDLSRVCTCCKCIAVGLALTRRSGLALNQRVSGLHQPYTRPLRVCPLTQ